MSEQNEYSASSTYDYPFSFSGTDVEAYIIQGNYTYKLNSLSTVSFQVNEQKSPVRRLGCVFPVGFTRAIRTIAGTLVLTVLKDHPFAMLNAGERTMLQTSNYHPLTFFLVGGKKIIQNEEFDLLLTYQSEGNKRFYSQFKIKGINLISQSMVTSVNDMVTEMVFQFMARDFDDFELIENNEEKQEKIAKKEPKIDSLDNSKTEFNWQKKLEEIQNLLNSDSINASTRQRLNERRIQIEKEITKNNQILTIKPYTDLLKSITQISSDKESNK